MTAKEALFVALGGFTLFYLATIGSAARAVIHGLIGFVTNFFDTLGVGSFATTTSMFRWPAGLIPAFAAVPITIAWTKLSGNAADGTPLDPGARIRWLITIAAVLVAAAVFWLWRRYWLGLPAVVPDQLIPGTLNVGHTLPTIAQAFIYIAIIEVDMTTLIAMIAASVAGAWLGASIVAGWPARKVRLGMGCALLATAALMLMRQRGWIPAGGDTLDLQGARLVLGVAGNFGLGALMSLGIGLYAPCMILVSMLGMQPTAAFPIMMGSCAFLMPVGSARFVRAGSFDAKAAVGLAVGGFPAVIIAAKIVESLDLDAVRYLVVTVVTYTAISMLRDALTDDARPASTDAVHPS